ncbi:hypothetical protein X733_33225 [Mesorhizobium sp. L2C067A000]|nr:hypothetical protein X733_33225 [Mesorhizobium sp. L2C067A000]
MKEPSVCAGNGLGIFVKFDHSVDVWIDLIASLASQAR